MTAQAKSVGYPQGLIESLLNAIPELRADYEAKAGSLPGPYVTFSVLLNPLLWRSLEAGDAEERLRRIFGLVELLAADSDNRVKTLVATEVLEPLALESIGARARRYMGPQSLAMFEECERFVAAASGRPRLRQWWSGLRERVDKKAKVRRIMGQLRSNHGVADDPHSSPAEFHELTLSLADARHRLIEAGEKYLRGEAIAAPARFGAAPILVRRGDWPDEASAKAAQRLRFIWFRLKELAETLGD